MKKNIFILFLALSSSILFISCKNSTPSSSGVEVKSTGNEQYSCTMHPEIESDKPGDCSKCGMPLVKKEPADTIHMHNQSDTTHMIN